MTADRYEARQKAAAYRKQLKRRNDPEYETAATAYELLAQGKRLMDIGIAIRDGGFDEKMRPKLAIARADRHQVHFHWPWSSDTARFDANTSNGNYQQMIETVNFNRRHNFGGQWHMVQGYALVPMIPADVRPNVRLADCHILWEVEQWADERISAKPPVDPYLLKRVAGDLFVILAEWDLTELERSVMAGRARVTV